MYVCTYVFLLHQESFDMILVNNSSFYDESVKSVGLAYNSESCHQSYTIFIGILI
jgi:hypothetical protein